MAIRRRVVTRPRNALLSRKLESVPRHAGGIRSRRRRRSAVGAGALHFFRGRGAWLVDLADAPVNRLKGRERTSAATARIDRLASLITATQPECIFVAKTSIDPAVRQAAQAASFDG